MSTTATVTEQLYEIDESVRRAWLEYYDYLHELSGRDYEDAELEAWELLQEELHDIEERRQALAALPPVE